jgi:hypothetical protein
MKTTVIFNADPASLADRCPGKSCRQAFEKYSGLDGYTSVYISKYMFGLFSAMDNKDKDIDDVLSRLTGIRILASENAARGVNFFT